MKIKIYLPFKYSAFVLCERTQKISKKKHTKSVKFNVNIEGKGVVDRSSTVIAKDPEGKHFFAFIQIYIHWLTIFIERVFCVKRCHI